MTKDEALKLALEALEYWDVHGKLHQPTEEAITAIKEALYKVPPPCPTCEALARTVMMDQTGRDA